MLSFPSLTLRKDYYIQDCINCIRVLSFFLACLIFVLYPVLYSSESLLRTVDYKNMFYIVTNVTGSQHFSSDLVQWGSEMTCTSRLIWYDITLGLEFVGEGGEGLFANFFPMIYQVIKITVLTINMTLGAQELTIAFFASSTPPSSGSRCRLSSISPIVGSLFCRWSKYHWELDSFNLYQTKMEQNFRSFTQLLVQTQHTSG